MNRYKYHIVLVTIVSFVVLTINIMAYLAKDEINYLYLFDIGYVVGNSAHFVALSISSNGISIEDDFRKTS